MALKLFCDTCAKELTDSIPRSIRLFEPDTHGWRELDLCQECLIKIKTFIEDEVFQDSEKLHYRNLQ